MDTSDLIVNCSSGDRDAMAELYRIYSLRLLRLILCYVKDRQAAEDILHDGFLIVFTHISEVKDSSKLEFWMGRIMKNLCIKYISTTQNYETLTHAEDIEEEISDDDIPSKEEIEALIGKLPDGYKRVFRLAVLEGKSHTEIADLLGIAPHSSSSQLARARAMLRRLIIERRKIALWTGMILILLAVVLYDYLKVDINMDPGVPMVAEKYSGVESEQIEELSGQTSIAEALVLPRKEQYSDNAGNPDEIENSESTDEPELSYESDNADVTVSSDSSDSSDKSEVLYDTSQPLILLPTPARKQSTALSLSVNYGSTSSSPVQTFNDIVQASPGDPVTPPAPPAEMPVEVKARHHRPLTIGLLVSKTLGDRISLSTGLTFTRIKSEFGFKSEKGKAECETSSMYMGIPLNLNYRIVSYDAFSLYGSGGVEFAIPVSFRNTVAYDPDALVPAFHANSRWAFSGGFGIQLSLTRSISLYVQPSVTFRPHVRSTLPTYWDEHPLMFEIPVGLRFEW